MATYYIDYQNGLDANNGTSESTPKKNFPTAADGDVFRVLRGSTSFWNSQMGFGDRQAIIVTDYGNPAAPKPAIEATHATGGSTVNHKGDAIWHNIELRNFQRTTGETTASNTGQNALLFAPRGGGTAGTVEATSGVIIGCDFKNIGNNAIAFQGITAASQIAFASPVGIVLGCSFDGIGGDAIYGSIRDYLEVGWCDFRDLGNRIEPLVTDNPAGSRQSASDAIGLILSVPQLTWIHDCKIDHSTWDCKHGIMLDAPSTQSNNLAIIERNIIIGYGSAPGMQFAQSINNVGVNTKVRTIMRQNLVRGSRILLNVFDQSPWSDIYSNFFDVTGIDGSNPAIAVLGDQSSFHGNSVVARSKLSGTAVSKSSSADKFAAYQNLIQGFTKGFDLSNPAQAAYRRNAFFGVDVPYSNGATPLTADATDVVDATPSIKSGAFTSSDARLMFKQVDRRVPDFWGRFASDGIAHIGATIGAL